MSIEAMKLIRDAIERGDDLTVIGAKHILDQAIAEAEKQEPVAYLNLDDFFADTAFKQYDEKGVCRVRFGTNETTFYNEKGEVTLTVDASNPVASEYHTQSAREWVGLTDEEYFSLIDQIDDASGIDLIEYGQAVIAKWKEKNT